MTVCMLGVQEKILDPLEKEFKVVVSRPMWVLGIEP